MKALLAVAMFLGCSTNPGVYSGDNDGTGGDGAGANGGGGAFSGGKGGSGGNTGGNADANFTFVIPDGGQASGRDAVCGLVTVKLQRQPADLVVVLDRSSTMGRTPVGAAPPATLWSETTAALNEVVMKTDTVVNWGLKAFPISSGKACDVAPMMEVPVAPSNYKPVGDYMTMNSWNTVNPKTTPTGAAVRNATAYLKSLKTPYPKYLVIGTDGHVNCLAGTQNSMQAAYDDAVASIREAAMAGFPVFVVGILAATAPALEAATLTRMAMAGGKPRTGDPKYYPAMLKNELVEALSDITKQIASCTFPLDKAPPAPDDVAVNVDGMRVMRNAANGWDYTAGMKSIVISGAACDRIKASNGSNVEIIFGCPGVIIP